LTKMLLRKSQIKPKLD